jgi:CspA family cold shock protein
MSERITGVVKWYNVSKGYGFITPDGGARDVFVHHSEIKTGGGRATLDEGQRVEFSIEETPKGPQAVGVVKL